ncbi:hypothetical protein RJ640_022241, partial [Escallonia rubra]
MFGFFFIEGPVFNFEDAKKSDMAKFARFFRGMLEEGVYFAPSQFEAGFTSLAHASEDIQRTIAAADKSCSFKFRKGKKRKGKTAASGTISSPEAAAETPAKWRSRTRMLMQVVKLLPKVAFTGSKGDGGVEGPGEVTSAEMANVVSTHSNGNGQQL